MEAGATLHLVWHLPVARSASLDTVRKTSGSETPPAPDALIGCPERAVVDRFCDVCGRRRAVGLTGYCQVALVERLLSLT